MDGLALQMWPCFWTPPPPFLYPLSILTRISSLDELFLHRHSNLASLPGPVVLLDSEPSLHLEGKILPCRLAQSIKCEQSVTFLFLLDEPEVIKEVTIGVLPAFALVAVIGLVAVLTNLIRKSKV